MLHSSSRSMPITPVPARPGAVLPKSATSRPLTPVIAKMIPGASSALAVGRERSSIGCLERREPHEVKSIAMSVSGIGGSSTTDFRIRAVGEVVRTTGISLLCSYGRFIVLCCYSQFLVAWCLLRKCGSLSLF